MDVLVLDVENSVTIREEDKYINGRPYLPSNKLVSVGYQFVGEEECHYDFFHHKDLETPTDPAKLQAALDRADLVVAHNAKYDMQWLFECGFTHDGPIWDTMIAEYVLLRGMKDELSLAALCRKYKLPHKKGELIDDYWKQGIGFDQMPMDIVEEYGRGDIASTIALYLEQVELYSRIENLNLVGTRDLMNEFCLVLTHMERNGIKIDLDALEEVDEEYRNEREQLLRRLSDLTYDLMGDRPINLNSPEQLSWVLYSRKMKSKKAWAEAFNLGLDYMGKPKYKPRMTDDKFHSTVNSLTEKLRKQKAHQCPECKGEGWVQLLKKDGTPRKSKNKCKNCDATGLVYEDLPEWAGLKLRVNGVNDVTANGFSTAKDNLSDYADQARAKGDTTGAEFLSSMVRLNAVDSYLSSFVNGIRKATLKHSSILHPNFNQCVAATGRLSSSEPNFQNQPRGTTFPVRKTIVSRFEGGSIIEADFAQLEFRVAGFLARDRQVLADVSSGVDVHSNTAKALTDAGEPTDRQGAKANTFKPLYGGQMGTPAQMAYFQFFLNRYAGVAEWHERLVNEALRDGTVTLPSGREYAFPNAKRGYKGRVVGRTKIVNYPVQGFATGDIVPLACIRLHRLMQHHKVQSLLINTVHDSLVVDCYPGEEELIVKLMNEAMLYVADEMLDRWGCNYDMPFGVEVKAGSNWMDGKVVSVQEWHPNEERIAA